MGMAAETCSQTYQIGREEQDAYALESYKRAQQAIDSQAFVNEIVPVTITTRQGSKVVAEDEEVKKLDASKLKSIKPAFLKDGTVTAINASSLSDGAAALVLCSAAFVKKHQLKPLAVLKSCADASTTPVEFTTAPSLAIPKAIQRAGVKDVDLYEINEAFSVVSLANMKLLQLDPSKVNCRGGAVSLGHPLGCSGARIVVTLIHQLQSVCFCNVGRYWSWWCM
jgi:acetyl-CoA acetyltransferase family protein